MTKYNININFFENPPLWGQKQAYFLGWFGSDGYNSLENKIMLELQEKDKKILELLKKSIEYTGPLYYKNLSLYNRTPGQCKTKNGYREIKSTNSWRLQIARKKISEDLKKLGITNAKSGKYIFPEFLKDELIPHFLRAYYEGDGSFSYHCRYLPNRKRIEFKITLLGTNEFLLKVKQILKEKLNIESKISKCDRVKIDIQCLSFASNYGALKLFNYLYKDANMLLKRKFRKFLKLINYMKKVNFNNFHSETKTETQKAIILAKWLVKNAQY